MYRDKRIAVVMPAYNEARNIRRTLAGLPDYVDHIVVVDDASTDDTPRLLQEAAAQDARIVVIRHTVNQGCGVAKATCYIWCRDHDIDVVVAMDSDGQMDPAEMPSLLDPVVEDRADYAKGNRLVTGEAWKIIPRTRYLGNSALTLLTKIASGYWHVTDSQTGYSALNRKALKLLPWESLYPRYGWPNDLLVTLNIYNMRVMDVLVKPIYGVGEVSKMRIYRDVFRMSWLLVRLYLRRLLQKYIIRDFHPLVFFYALGAMLLLIDIPLLVRLVVRWFQGGSITNINMLAVLFCTFTGFQSILFAMLFDMEANRHLKGKE
ncbi:MAG TPA: glycosyltransferase family 2 protein [Phycisphaerae bacterium]|nr:glycosyltransferase family 2 protein [Phycisphaerae bacterium]